MRPCMRKAKSDYHHGNLAESLLDAVDELATKFGLEAVTLRACAKLIGVSPSSAFRHYADKRALLTAFATRALLELAAQMEQSRITAEQQQQNAFLAVGMAYIGFALEKPALFRAMWRDETIYSNDPDYRAATQQLSSHLQSGFADTITDHDPDALSAQELLAWSAVHGLASLFVDGPVARGEDLSHKQELAQSMLAVLGPVMEHAPKHASKG